MKIAFITSTFPSPDKPSLGIFNLRAAKAIAHHSDLTVYKLRMWKPGRQRVSEDVYEGLRVKTYALPLLPFNNIYGYIVSSYITSCLLRKEIRKERFDLLFSSGIDYAGLFSALIAPYAKATHVAQVIGSDVNFDLPKLNALGFARVFNKGVHGILCVCDDLKKRVSELLPQITNVTVAYRGIDLQKFQYHPLVSDNSTNTRFLFLGGFPGGNGDDGINLKGGITLTTLWKENESHFKQQQFTLRIGGVNAGDQWVHDWRTSLQYPEQVEIVGTVNSDKARELIIDSHIVLLPSLAEGLPNIAVESAALGRVVLGSKVNGVPEIILHSITGVVLPPRDVAAWTEAMLTYGKDKKRLQEMGLAARKHVSENFDGNNFAPLVLNFFNSTHSKQSS